jgi:hypothetical protein
LQKCSAENRFAEWLLAKFFRIFSPGNLEPILRFFNLQLQRQRCSRLEIFLNRRKMIFSIKSAMLLTAL